MMRTPGGCWKFGALVVVVIVAVLGYLGWRLFRGLNPPPTPITQIGELSRLTGLALPPQTILLEGARWKNYFLVARLSFPRTELAGFLAHGIVLSGKRGSLRSYLSFNKSGSLDIFHDSCEIEDGEQQFLDHCQLKGRRPALTGSNFVGTPYPIPNYPALNGSLSLSLDLDDPRTVILFVRWDARGGFAC